MNTFTLFWLDGKREVVHGGDIASAMTKAGYGNGALRALDFHAKGDNDKYKWNSVKLEWNLIEPADSLLYPHFGMPLQST